MSESVNYCDVCGTKLVDLVCRQCSTFDASPVKNNKSRLGVGILVGFVVALIAVLGFNWVSNSSTTAGNVLNSVTETLDSCKGEAGCEFAKEALKNGVFIVYERDTYTNLVNYCDQMAPGGLVDNPDGNEDEVYARTNWIVPCINVLYAEYENKFGRAMANP